MDRRRWDDIRAAFDELVELDDAGRASRLAAISTTDPELREAVDVLLRADADADAWLAPVESPLGVAPTPDGRSADSVSPDLQARLQNALGSAYRIARELGGGGMSHVYVAEETAFRRKVVVKVLRPELAEAISAKRFQREIQLAARLQHPHIVPLLSAGKADGVLYYTMPFVDGESLRDRLRREGELPIDDTLRIVRDVASALAYAHRHGVVHRDIKPENVLLCEGGAVVADFGIAKALSASRAHGDAATTSTTITERGMALGTPLYMAPEQAAGEPAADHRADLYALGALAYEMLAGRPPFEGRSAQQLMAAHATEEPDPITKRRPNTPPRLAALVMRCLEKRPADRPHDAEQVLLALDHAASTAPSSRLSSAGMDTATAGSTRWSIPRRAWALTAALVAAVASLAIAAWPRSHRQAQPSWFDLVLPDSATPRTDYGDLAMALSPDGSVLVYVGASNRSLFLRPLDELSVRRLEGTDGAACPSFSPDGRWIVFNSNLRLKKVAVRGGSPITIADSAGCPVWTDRNEIVFNWKGPLYRVSANGGPASLLTPMDSTKRIGVMIPSHALPGGNAALICLSENVEARWQVGVASLPSGRITRLTVGGFPRCPARYADGHVVFVQNRTIVAAPFSPRTLRLTGPEVALLRDTIGAFATAENGTMAYLARSPQTYSLVAVGEGGRTRTLGGNADGARLRGSAPMPLDTGRYSWPRLSPDGKRVVMQMQTAGDLWVYDIGSRTLSRLTANRTGIQPLGWTADGRSVVFTQVQSGDIAGPRRIVTQPWNGSAPARELIRFPDRFARSIFSLFDISIGPPHGHAAFVVANFSDTADIWVAPLDTPAAARPLVATRAREFQPRLSPDGTLLAYTSDETGRFEVYVRSVMGPSTRLQVSAEGGQQPLWSRDGRQLFYRAPGRFEPEPRIGGGVVMRATIAVGAELSVVRSDTLFRDEFNLHDVVNYDVFPGGKELLMIRPNPPGPAHASVVLNWPALLRPRGVTR